MAFNLNISRKPERNLYKNNINEIIEMYGIKCKYLYSEKINIDKFVFKDFSHLKVDNTDQGLYKDIYLLPEDTENWEGDVLYNLYGFNNQWTQHLFISQKMMYELYPKFLDTGRHNLVNSLIITPSSTILEITHVESYDPGMTNTWGHADQPSSYKLTVKIYDHNLPDENIRDIKTNIELEEGNDGIEIFNHNEEIDTSDIDSFFEEMKIEKENIEEQSSSGKTGTNNTNSPFGNLS